MQETDIVCNFVEIKNDLYELPKGLYLQISVNKGDPIFIPYSKLEDFKIRDPINISPNVVNLDEKQDSLEVGLNIGSDYNKDFLSFIFSKLKIDDNYLDSITTATVISDNSNFLELPWEDFFSNSEAIFRKYNDNAERQFTHKQKNNLAIFMSHAHIGIGSDLSKCMNEEIDGIYESQKILRKNNQQSFRVESIFLLKHTTKKSLGSISLASYNYLHFISHGDLNGNIVLEVDDPTRYKDVDILSKSDFIKFLSTSTFELIFLSLCNSAGDRDNADNTAFQLVKNGTTNYCIAYNGQTSEISASRFAPKFYESLLSGKSIKETYKKALLLYKSEQIIRKDIPHLYIS